MPGVPFACDITNGWQYDPSKADVTDPRQENCCVVSDNDGEQLVRQWLAAVTEAAPEWALIASVLLGDLFEGLLSAVMQRSSFMLTVDCWTAVCV